MTKTDTNALKAACIILVRTLAVLAVIVTAAVAQPQPKTIAKQRTHNSHGGGHSSSPTGIGGPDAFGYRWIDLDEIGGPPPFPFNDISTFGTRITVMSSGNFDDGYATTALPFPFPFYGTTYSSINVGTNGFVNFGTGSTAFGNESIPSAAAPNNAIYAFWDDLDLRSRGKLYVYNDTFTGRFIIQYDSVPRFAQSTSILTFQIILRPNGTIQTHYRDMMATDLNSATIGLENAAGTVALQVVNNAAYMHDNLAIQFAPPNSLLTWAGPQSDATWENPNQWDPRIVPTLFDSATVRKGIMSQIQLFQRPSIGVAALRILDTGSVTFNTFNNGVFVVTRSLRIDSTGSFFLLNADTISVGLDMNLSGGTFSVSEVSASAIYVGRSWLRSSNSVFINGKSKVVFTGNGVLSRNFYDLLINAGSAMTTVGNISVANQLDVRDSLGLRRQDSLLITKPDPSALIGSGLVRHGTIQRAIQSGVSARYRFESDSTYLFFSTGTFPSKVNVTTYPDSLIPSQNFVQFGGQVIRNPATNSIVIGGIIPYKRWAIGIPRYLTSPNSGPLLVKRMYDITAVGPTTTSVTLSLRYEQSELQPGMDENTLELFYYDPLARNWTWYIDGATTNPGSPGYLDVTIGIRANTATDEGRLGNHTLRGTMSSALYDFGAAHDPVLQSDLIGGNYSATMTNPSGANNWQRNGVLNVIGSGAPVTTSGTRVAVLRFFILNQNGSSLFTLGTLQQTYEDNNTTLVALSHDTTGGNIPLPVQLSSFTATVLNQSRVRLNWTTISEVNNYGFFVERKRSGDSSFTEIPNSFVPGHGTTNEPHDYTFTDQSPNAPTLQYRLRQVDLDGTIHYTEPIQVSGITSVEGREVAPLEFTLKQNYPNPFNPSTEIKFSVERTDRATLDLYNITGQKVATLFDDVVEAGQYYRVRVDGSNLASGVYFYRLMGNGKVEQKKLMLLR